MTLDRNRTVWQRLNDQLLVMLPRGQADELTTVLHPYVIAERDDARTTSTTSKGTQ